MKLSAITSRSILKDYVDLYFILHQIDLRNLINLTKEKFPSIDTNPILKSLIYFEDIQKEPILFKHNNDVSFELIKNGDLVLSTGTIIYADPFSERMSYVETPFFVLRLVTNPT
jgi:hypothetical protein